jgi:uncharacterized protein YjiS (DUF1127 family)
MRDYVLHQSQRRLPTGGVALMVTWFRNWQSRKSFAKLAKLSDYQLRDIGLSRTDVLYMSRLPLAVDPTWEADRLRLLNSKKVD